MPTAGVQGVCPLSIFLRANLRSRYWQQHFVLLMRSRADGASIITAIPGAQAKAYWLPEIITPVLVVVMSNGSQRKVEIVSTIRKQSLRLQNSDTRLIS